MGRQAAHRRDPRGNAGLSDGGLSDGATLAARLASVIIGGVFEAS
jgi:hypothetical protein